MSIADVPWLPLALALIYLAAAACIYRILMTYRVAQGAIAWILALIGLPYVAVPMFLLFGRNRFGGYIRARRTGDAALTELLNHFEQQTAAVSKRNDEHVPDELQVLCKLGRQPFTTGNRCDLLKNGEATFEALFDAMENARHYILLEFYIVRSDKVGQRIKSILKRKLAQGVQVWFLYDDIGSVWLPRKYLRELAAAGAKVASFGDGNFRRMRLQVNFRNHRKLLVCDGEVGFVGGINLGDEYLGTAMDEEPWRDSHCRITGPAVTGLQLAWLEDWNWASEDFPTLNWTPSQPKPGNQEVLILPTGPADTYETCTLFFLNCINNARTRIWIASPYFVPDVQIMNALQLAALRGVDVRIIIPEKSDSRLIRLAAYSYLVQACRAGIGIYRYQPGFMHQKVVLVDDRYAAIGTANLDNRSMRLNFEITAISTAVEFVSGIEHLLEQDLTTSRLMTERDYRDRSVAFRLTCRTIRLLGPLL
ncbi:MULTISPECIES: cardiolipin synthase [Marinobacter]|jgi:cardiolipin synthase|uniref:Cardiolipin synthase n=1 Tax=Marinobacter salarius TaxID=1420917 RepID=A0A1W6KED9_9GAMM|nr:MULTISPECIES: cardiolipin synthase [Marinobacter]ARM85682.1 major cardiolipin synthase ClsA [Marinobacter salarius]MBJ7275111.1 cardiolipin synthase [Marinobacter salarius]MDC8457623.1 cardiolipin synthase [Marinobacter sp. DS40M6]|tara:strand:- start:289 stop:1725 length:1437 start_codon:yes stop_codon:yes gene_type:complete